MVGSLRVNRTSQQIKEEKIIFLLEDVEKNLEKYLIPRFKRKAVVWHKKKILVSAKNSYYKTVAENKELKAYIQNIKHRFQEYQQQQQARFLENQKITTKKENQKGTKKLFTKKNLIVTLN